MSKSHTFFSIPRRYFLSYLRDEVKAIPSNQYPGVLYRGLTSPEIYALNCVAGFFTDSLFSNLRPEIPVTQKLILNHVYGQAQFVSTTSDEAVAQDFAAQSGLRFSIIPTLISGKIVDVENTLTPSKRTRYEKEKCIGNIPIYAIQSFVKSNVHNGKITEERIPNPLFINPKLLSAEQIKNVQQFSDQFYKHMSAIFGDKTMSEENRKAELIHYLDRLEALYSEVTQKNPFRDKNLTPAFRAIIRIPEGSIADYVASLTKVERPVFVRK